MAPWHANQNERSLQQVARRRSPRSKETRSRGVHISAELRAQNCPHYNTLNNSPFYPYSVFVCSVWLWEQTAIISLHCIILTGFYKRRSVFTARYGLDLYHLKTSGNYMYHQFNIQQFYVLPTHCIYVFCVDLRTNSDYFPTQQWVFYNRDLTLYRPVVTICTASLTFKNSTFCPHSVFMCFLWIWEQTAIISLYNINWLVFL